MPPQQVTTGPTPMEGVEKTNTVVVREQEQGMEASRKDPYTMEVDRGRNCYACRGFGHMAYYYRNWRKRRVMEGRRVEYGGERFKSKIKQIRHLKEVENLEALN